jgi:hypothetical protein
MPRAYDQRAAKWRVVPGLCTVVGVVQAILHEEFHDLVDIMAVVSLAERFDAVQGDLWGLARGHDESFG